MKIGFLAMSGIRVHDPGLMELGLTLPGFVERGRAIASLPSLGLLYLAACTPDGHELRYFEADTSVPPELFSCDLVAISTFTAQVREAYAIADRLREHGVKVAMGGLHVSVLPDEALQHADYVVCGEGENVWADVVRAAGCREQPRVFPSSDYAPVDTASLPVPRYDLLAGRSYNRYTVQATRGCPWRCDFCASSVMLQRPYRKRPTSHVVRDIRAITAVQPGAFVEFADDNTFVDKTWGKELCRALLPLGVKWFTETDVTVADDPELLDLMCEAGCRQVLVGLESPTPGALAGIEQKADIKSRWAARYRTAIRQIQSRGITVNACFILGLDGHTAAVFDDVRRFAEEAAPFDVQITVLTPFPGTPLYERLLAEGRILEPEAWHLCTLFDVNFRPAGMTPDELRDGIYELSRHLYSAEATKHRRREFFRHQTPMMHTS